MPGRHLTSSLVVAEALAMLPLGAQLRMDAVAVAPPLTPRLERCAAASIQPVDAAWARVFDALDADGSDAALAGLEAMEDSLRAEMATRPGDVRLRYLIATSAAVRTDFQQGLARVHAAGDLHTQLAHILALEPGHAGAQHLLGRLHAGVMRLDGFTRFVATRLLGGGPLASASWSEAERLLHAAATSEPCVPDHHYELARLYADRGRPGAALRQVRLLLALDAPHPRATAVERKALRLVEDLLFSG